MSWFRRTGLLLALTGMFTLSGGHWLVLQAVAWTQMAVEYSQDRGVIAGLEKTFSGKSPCKLCLKVQEGRQQEEQKPAVLKTDKKPEFLLGTAALTQTLRLPTSFFYPVSNPLPPASHREAPPLPVPILV